MKILLNHKVVEIIFIIGLAITDKYTYGQQMEVKYKMAPDYDSFDIKSVSYLLSQAHLQWRYYHTFSVSYLDIPAAWVLQKINAPLITYNAKFSLPYGFDLQ